MMPIARHDIALAYRLFLGREASSAEIDGMAAGIKDTDGLRKVFFNSAEFQAQIEAQRKQKRAESPSTLIHIDVPMTAGSHLNGILARNVAADRVLEIDEPEIEKLLSRKTAERARLKVVMGQIQHGVAQHLPQKCLHVMVLSEPGPRIYSFFRHICRTDTHRLHPEFHGSQTDFGRFLRLALEDAGLRQELDNGQTRRLSGQMQNLGIDPREMFGLAMSNMTAPDMIIGTSERFEALLYTLWTRGLIADAANCFETVAGETDSFAAAVEALDPDERGLLESYCYWDRLLHQAASLLVDGTQCDIPEAAAVA